MINTTCGLICLLVFMFVVHMMLRLSYVGMLVMINM
jgi:hypothetical protein